MSRLLEQAVRASFLYRTWRDFRLNNPSPASQDLGILPLTLSFFLALSALIFPLSEILQLWVDSEKYPDSFVAS